MAQPVEVTQQLDKKCRDCKECVHQLTLLGAANVEVDEDLDAFMQRYLQVLASYLRELQSVQQVCSALVGIVAGTACNRAQDMMVSFWYGCKNGLKLHIIV